MNIKVNAHNVELTEVPINEKEINVTKCYFEFDSEMEDYVKEAYFTLNGNTYKVLIQNNECNIPYEALEQKGILEIGVVAYQVEDEETIIRYNPSPAFITTWTGSLKEADNTEPITPTDKEQIEQALLEVQNQMDNLDIEAEKVEDTATITITHKDGTTTQVQIKDGEDGEKGDKGDKGEPGAIKMLIVAELPETGADDTIYLVPITPDTSGNNYAEYVYINGAWELLGKIGVQVDLTDYVKNTDYASSSKGGVIKPSGSYLVGVSNSGDMYCNPRTYSQYVNDGDYAFISKGTLENVITGKGLVSNTDYANTTTGGVFKAGLGFNVNNGYLGLSTFSTSDYATIPNTYPISKGTLNNVLDAKIGDIQTLLDDLDSGSGV